ncbi:hypothetical protein [Nocardia tengchongensis]|uniref:hypothetical protein n=1 Tax=Nocardia tengchongensis TaxID=2055889 RepID=UPI003687C95A
MKHKITAGLAATGGALAVTAALGAQHAGAVEPTLSWGVSAGGTSINHFTTVPAGALFDGDIGTLTPAVAPGVVGVLSSTSGGHCVSGQFAFYPKDGGEPEVVPVGVSCGLPVIYGRGGPPPGRRLRRGVRRGHHRPVSNPHLPALPQRLTKARP